MCANYVATAYASTLVKYATAGQLLSGNRKQLVTYKGQTLEVQEITDGELRNARRIWLPFSICGLWTFRPSSKAHKDLLFILTKTFDALVIELTETKKDLSMNVKVCGSYPSNSELSLLEGGPIVSFHPDQKIICLALYNQRFEIIKVNSAECKSVDSFPIRVDNVCQRGILSMAFVSPNSADLSVVLLQSTNKGRSLVFSGFNIQKKLRDMSDVCMTRLDLEADYLIALPFPKPNPGVLVIGDACVQFYNRAKEYCSISSPFLHKLTVISCCKVHEDAAFVSYVLAGADGRLVLLTCRHNTEPRDLTKPICVIRIQLLGITAAVQTMCVLEKGVLFLGAAAGPSSCVIRLRSTQNPSTKQYFDVMTSCPVLGAVLDLNMMRSSQKQGLSQSPVLACSADTQGDSLTIIRSGIKLQDPTLLEITAVENCWVVNFPAVDPAKPVFVLSELLRTRCFVHEEETLVEKDVGGKIECSVKSLLCADTSKFGGFLQVSPTKIVLKDRSSAVWSLVWTGPENAQISAAKIWQDSLCVAHGKTVRHFSIEKQSLEEISHHICAYEISTLAVFSDQSDRHFCAVGEWLSNSVHIFDLPSFSTINTVADLSDTQPQALCYFQFAPDHCFLFCGFGDGHVVYFHYDHQQTNKLTERRRLALGTRPFSFVPFQQHGDRNLFVTSDRPAVISYRNGKLSFASVNISDVVDACQLSIEEDSLVIVTRSNLSLGQLEDIQKIHLIPLHMGIQAYRAAFQAETSFVGVLGDVRDRRINKFLLGKRKDPCRRLYIVDKSSFEIAGQFSPTDSADLFLSICSWSSPKMDIPFFVLGTEKDRNGSIVILQMIEKRLQTLHTYSTDDPVRHVVPFDSWLLVATNSELIVYEWLQASHQLEERARHESGLSMIHSIDVQGRTVAVGDLRKSVVLLHFDDQFLIFRLIGRNYTGYAFQSIAVYDDSSVIGSDNFGNIVLLSRRLAGQATELEEQQKLMQETAWTNIGDAVTCIRRGYLTSAESVPDFSVKILNSLIFGTCKGQLGVMLQLESDLFALLRHVESKLIAKIEKKFDLIAHKDPFLYETNMHESPHEGFVNGDLLETFLDLKEKEMDDIMKGYSGTQAGSDRAVTASDVVKILDDLIRLH